MTTLETQQTELENLARIHAEEAGEDLTALDFIVIDGKSDAATAIASNAMVMALKHQADGYALGLVLASDVLHTMPEADAEEARRSIWADAVEHHRECH